MIRLHIKCFSDGDDTLADLGIGEPSTQYRPVWIRKESINYFYPNLEGGTFISINGEDIQVRESFEYVKDTIDA